jgi:hypothetical protein
VDNIETMSRELITERINVHSGMHLTMAKIRLRNPMTLARWNLGESPSSSTHQLVASAAICSLVTLSRVIGFVRWQVAVEQDLSWLQ